VLIMLIRVGSKQFQEFNFQDSLGEILLSVYSSEQKCYWMFIFRFYSKTILKTMLTNVQETTDIFYEVTLKTKNEK